MNRGPLLTGPVVSIQKQTIIQIIAKLAKIGRWGEKKKRRRQICANFHIFQNRSMLSRIQKTLIGNLVTLQPLKLL